MTVAVPVLPVCLRSPEFCRATKRRAEDSFLWIRKVVR